MLPYNEQNEKKITNNKITINSKRLWRIGGFSTKIGEFSTDFAADSAFYGWISGGQDFNPSG